MNPSHPYANKIRSVLDAIEKGHHTQFFDGEGGWVEDTPLEAICYLSSEGCDPSNVRTQELFGPRL